MGYQAMNKPLDWFSDNPDNYRAHPQEQQAVLQESLRRFGVFRNVVARPDGTLLAGHGIIAAARAEGLTEFPCVVFEGTDAEARALMVADNEQARLAQDDPGQLSQLLSSLQADGLLGLTGHDDDSLQALLAEVSPEPAEPLADPGAGELPAEAVTRPGDVWLLGKHRLVCGDCREAPLWEQLLGGKRIRMVWTDPPYGVSYADKNEFLNAMERGNRNQTPIANDHMTEQATEDLCREALTMACAHAEKGGAVYVACPAGTLLPLFISAVAGSGYTFRHSLAWVKQQFVIGRCDYHYRHETILYGWKEDGAHYFVDDHTKDSVFNIDKPHSSKEHPTMKPVELVAEMVANSSMKGEIVADPFLGSGTTLIACEQLNRVCYGIEIEPRYCDVIINRWQTMTGQQAILESTGQTYQEAAPNE